MNDTMTDTSKKPDIKVDFSHPLKNLRHEQFSQLYVTSPFDVGVIYKEAGYKCSSHETDRVNAYKLLRMDTVRGRIKWLVEERNIRLGLDGNNVIKGLYMMRDRCAGGQPVLDRQGNFVTVFDENDNELKCLWKADVAGFNRASELLAKFHGLLVERTINTNVNVNTEKLEEEADEYINNIRYSRTIKPKDAQARLDSDKAKALIPIDSSNRIDDTIKSDIVVYDETGKVVTPASS